MRASFVSLAWWLTAAGPVFGVLQAQDLTRGSKYSVQVTDGIPYGLTVKKASDDSPLVNNIAIRAGSSNTTAWALGSNDTSTLVSVRMISDTAVEVQINSTKGFTGATFTGSPSSLHYGVWGYPFKGSLTNNDFQFDLKGLQGNKGVNYNSVRAPFFMASEGYAVYADTMTMGSYAFAGDKSVSFTFNSTTLTYYIILPKEDKDMKSLISQYVGLSDSTALFSLKAYGPMFWHNDWTRKTGWPAGVTNSEAFIRDTVDKLHANKIRASAIMVDRPYGTGTEGWGNWDFDGLNWPNPAGLFSELSSLGIDLQIWVANRAVPGSELYAEADNNGWLYKEMVTKEDAAVALNLSYPAAVTYMKQGMKNFTDLGVKGYKIDRGDEDEMPVWEQNIQSYLYHKLLYEGQAEKWGGYSGNSSAGFYSFARSVNDRSRRYTGVWGADPDSSEDGLIYSIRSGVRSGLLGFPIWGSDCGGYTRKIGQETPKEDLWARWAWFSAFSPVYEVMLYEGSMPWYNYSSKLVSVLSQTADIHHKLIPFIHSYAFQSTYNGLPLIRALFLEAPEDESVWDADESYFFGRELFVAPIVKASGTKSIYFPKGSKYLEYWNKTEVVAGGSTVSVTRDVYSAPVYVREGSIIPRGDIIKNNANWDENWAPFLDIDVYPSYAVARNTFQYFDDKAQKQVDITVVASKRCQRICVTYGALGVTGGYLRIYLKGGQQKFKIEANGTKQCVASAETLFD